VSIRVLVADDSEIMRATIGRVLEEHSRTEVVGEVGTFAETVRLIGDCKPKILLLYSHLAEKDDFPPGFVKSQLARLEHTLAALFWNDAQAFAESYGGENLLDKINLYGRLIPVNMQRCSYQAHSGLAILRRETNEKSTPHSPTIACEPK